jgi:hypothetical protein
LLILTEELSEEEQEIYKEVLSLEWLVDWFGFLSGLRGEEEAVKLVENYFSRVVENFISLKK